MIIAQRGVVAQARCTCRNGRAAPNSKAMALGLIRQAMAYRVKYRVVDGDGGHTRKMPLSLLGVHNRNPGGVYPSPEAVENLGLKLLSQGFSLSEANHEGGACKSCRCMSSVQTHWTTESLT